MPTTSFPGRPGIFTDTAASHMQCIHTPTVARLPYTISSHTHSLSLHTPPPFEQPPLPPPLPPTQNSHPTWCWSDCSEAHHDVPVTTESPHTAGIRQLKQTNLMAVGRHSNPPRLVRQQHQPTAAAAAVIAATIAAISSSSMVVCWGGVCVVYECEVCDCVQVSHKLTGEGEVSGGTTFSFGLQQTAAAEQQQQQQQRQGLRRDDWCKALGRLLSPKSAVVTADSTPYAGKQPANILPNPTPQTQCTLFVDTPLTPSCLMAPPAQPKHVPHHTLGWKNSRRASPVAAISPLPPGSSSSSSSSSPAAAETTSLAPSAVFCFFLLLPPLLPLLPSRLLLLPLYV